MKITLGLTLSLLVASCSGALAQAASAALLPNAKQTFVDGNGQPLSGGKVFFYLPSTTTTKTTWQDSAETTPNSNPVVLDSAGRAIIYGSGNYRELLEDQFGQVVWDGLTTGSPTGGTYISPQTYGAKCDGVTNDRQAFFNANAAAVAANQGLLVTGGGPGECVIGSNLTLSAPVVFAPGGVLFPSNAVTVTVNAPVQAGVFQIFDPSSNGLIRGTMQVSEIYPEWWLVSGASTSQTRVALQAALDYARNSSYPQVKEVWGANYTLDGIGLTWAGAGTCPVIEGLGQQGVTLNLGAPGSETAALLISSSVSGGLCGGHISGVAFQSSSAANAVGLELQGVGGFSWVLDSATMKRAVLLCNCATGEFTEFDHGTVLADSTTTTALEYRVSGGNASFHGSGLDAGSVINSLAGNTAVLISASANVYDAPLSGTFFGHDNGATHNITLIQNNSTATASALFKGTVGVESQNSGTTTLAGTHQVFLAGQVIIQGNSAIPSYGMLYVGQTFGTIASTNWQMQFGPVQKIVSFAGTAALVAPYPPNFGSTNQWQYELEITDTNYIYVCNGAALSDDLFGVYHVAGNVCTSFLDTGAWGAPTVTIDSAGVHASNGNYTVTTVGYSTLTQLGQGAQHHGSQ